VKEFEEERNHIVRDGFFETNPFFKDEFIPEADQINLVSSKYGYER